MATAAPSEDFAALNGTDTSNSLGESYWTSKLYKDYVYDKDASATFCLCLSLVGGFAVIFVIMRKMRAKLTNFDRLVLSLTLWQFVYDFTWLFMMQIVPDKYGRTNSQLYIVFCGPDCRDRTAVGDDDQGPKHVTSPYVVTYFVLLFLAKWSSIAAGLCSNLLTTTVVWIVALSRMPSWLMRNFIYLMITIAALSIVIPLVQLVYFTNGVSEFPYRGDETDDFRPASEKTPLESQLFDVRINKTITSFHILIVGFNFICVCIVAFVQSRLKTPLQSQGVGDPMTEVVKRLAFYPLIQLVTKLPELRYFLECYEKTTDMSYWESNEFRVCQSARNIIPSTTGFLFSLTWFYFQPIYGKTLRAAMNRVSALLVKIIAQAKSAEKAVEPAAAEQTDPTGVQELDDDDLVGLISRRPRQEPEPGLELAQEGVVNAVDNPIAPPMLVVSARRLTLPSDKREPV